MLIHLFFVLQMSFNTTIIHEHNRVRSRAEPRVVAEQSTSARHVELRRRPRPALAVLARLAREADRVGRLCVAQPVEPDHGGVRRALLHHGRRVGGPHLRGARGGNGAVIMERGVLQDAEAERVEERGAP